VTFELSLETHPFLRDHSLAGRPFLPLASGLDLFVHARGLTPPFSLSKVAVERGLLVNRPASVRVAVDQDHLRLFDLRPGGREVAVFSACVAPVGEAPAREAPGEAMSFPLTLEEFYRGRTFHGPLLQAVTGVTGMTRTSVSGTVTGSRPCEWIPQESRARWDLDPKAVDGAFQLAIFWAQCREGRGLLPRSVDEVTLLEPLPSGPMDVHIDLVAIDDEGVTGTIHITSNGRRLGWLRGVRARWADPRTFRAEKETS
jgi:hypothetical protein